MSSPGFIKAMTLTDATMLVAGTMIGSGIFIVSADMARTLGSPFWLLVAWVVTGIMTLLGALLILAPRDLYSAWCGLLPNLSGQQLGGMLMLGIGTPVYLVAGLWQTSAGGNIPPVGGRSP